ncbi:MAG: branched-chain amino acid ABC transporter permease, partial [Burkholderiaceae bacterium]
MDRAFKVDKLALVVIGLLALVPFQDMVYDLFMMKVFAFAIFAMSLNLLLGFTGLLSFGPAAVFGSAAYLTSHGIKEW